MLLMNNKDERPLLERLGEEHNMAWELGISHLDYHFCHASNDGDGLLMIKAVVFFVNYRAKNSLVWSPTFYNAVKSLLTALRRLYLK